MTASSIPSPRRALFACAFAAATAIVCAALAGAAVLVPAPLEALPVILAACIGLPMVAAYELQPAIVALRLARGSLGRRQLNRLRRELERLPETQHPLGL